MSDSRQQTQYTTKTASLAFAPAVDTLPAYIDSLSFDSPPAGVSMSCHEQEPESMQVPSYNIQLKTSDISDGRPLGYKQRMSCGCGSGRREDRGAHLQQVSALVHDAQPNALHFQNCALRAALLIFRGGCENGVEGEALQGGGLTTACAARQQTR
jgi:hypothetical protein